VTAVSKTFLEFLEFHTDQRKRYLVPFIDKESAGLEGSQKKFKEV